MAVITHQLAVLWVDEWHCDCEEEITVVCLLSNGCYYSVFFTVLWVDEWPVIVKKR